MTQIVKHNLCVLFGCSVEHPIIEYKAVSKVSIPTSASIGFTLYGLQTLAAPHCSMYIIHHLSHALELSDVTTWGPSKNVFSCTILFWPRDLTLRWCNSHTIDYISNVVYVCRRLTCQDRNVPGGPKLIIHFCLCITFLLNRKYKYFEWWKSFLGPLQFLLLSVTKMISVEWPVLIHICAHVSHFPWLSARYLVITVRISVEYSL